MKKQYEEAYDLHLLSKRKSEDCGEYIISEYWSERINKSDVAQTIKTLLAVFTNKIENKIVEILTTWLYHLQLVFSFVYTFLKVDI